MQYILRLCLIIIININHTLKTAAWLFYLFLYFLCGGRGSDVMA
jgi:hypothetical protein